MTLGEWAFEKGKRGLNESKFTLFTIGTAFLTSGLNVTTINERNRMFGKKILKNMNLGVHLKGSKRILMGQKSYFLLIKTYFLEYLRSERSPAARRCACFKLICDNNVSKLNIMLKVCYYMYIRTYLFQNFPLFLEKKKHV